MTNTDLSEGLSFEGRTIRVAGRMWSVDYDIHDCRLVDYHVVVLYDNMGGPRHRQFRNLEAFDLEGRKLWTAEHATSETADVYVSFMPGPPLTVLSFACFVCKIDPVTGRIIHKTFTK